MAEATAAVATGKTDKWGGGAHAQVKYGATLKPNTVQYNTQYRAGLLPKRMGRLMHIDLGKEEKLVCIVEMMRHMKISVCKQTLFQVQHCKSRTGRHHLRAEMSHHLQGFH